MTKKKRTYNTNLIKTRHSYSFSEIADIFKIHKRTVQSWRKEGLKILDETTKPYLVIGEDLKSFLIERRKKRKHTLKTGESFCSKCHAPRKSHPDKLSIEQTNRRLGKNAKQVLIKGICEVCNHSLSLFSSDRKVQELKESGLLLLEHEKTLYGIGDSSINTDIIGKEDGKCEC